MLSAEYITSLMLFAYSTLANFNAKTFDTDNIYTNTNIFKAFSARDDYFGLFCTTTNDVNIIITEGVISYYAVKWHEFPDHGAIQVKKYELKITQQEAIKIARSAIVASGALLENVFATEEPECKKVA